MPRDARRHLLTQLLNAGSVRTQEELATALADAGEAATQATVSRDLAAIGRGPWAGRLQPSRRLHAFGPSIRGPFGNRTATPPLQPHDRGNHGGVAPWKTRTGSAPRRGTLHCWPASSTPRPPKAWLAASPGTTPFSSPPPPPPRPSPWCVPSTPCKKAWPYEHALPRNPRLGLG